MIHGFGEELLLLLTTQPLRNSFKCLWRIVRAYLKRRCIEETIRYLKTCYDLENVRVLNYRGLQNLMPLLLAVMFFCACSLNDDQRLGVMANYVELAAKRACSACPTSNTTPWRMACTPSLPALPEGPALPPDPKAPRSSTSGTAAIDSLSETEDLWGIS